MNYSKIEIARRKLSRLRSTYSQFIVDADAALTAIEEIAGVMIDERFQSTDARAIMEVVAFRYRLPVGMLVIRLRTEHVAEARQVAMCLVRELLEMSLQEVGGVFSRDHGTVVNARKAVDRRREVDPKFQAKFSDIREQCRARLTQLAPAVLPASQNQKAGEAA